MVDVGGWVGRGVCIIIFITRYASADWVLADTHITMPACCPFQKKKTTLVKYKVLVLKS